MNLKHKMIMSVDKNEIATTRIFNFIKEFAAHTLLVDCLSLKIEEDEPVKDKSKFNQNNWNSKSKFKNHPIVIYNYSFNTEKAKLKKSPFYQNYEMYTKDIQGKVYYSNGKINRIIVTYYGDKNKMLSFIKFNQKSHTIIDRYYRLALASMTDTPSANKFLRGRIECSFKIYKGKCLLEHVISDEKYGENINKSLTSMGNSYFLPNMLLSVVGKRNGFYENFIIKFENNSFKYLSSIRLARLQKSFPNFPKLSELVMSDTFDDYLLVLEMEHI